MAIASHPNARAAFRMPSLGLAAVSIRVAQRTRALLAAASIGASAFFASASLCLR